jgi:hypothetical protein
MAVSLKENNWFLLRIKLHALIQLGHLNQSLAPARRQRQESRRSQVSAERPYGSADGVRLFVELGHVVELDGGGGVVFLVVLSVGGRTLLSVRYQHFKPFCFQSSSLKHHLIDRGTAFSCPE